MECGGSWLIGSMGFQVIRGWIIPFRDIRFSITHEWSFAIARRLLAEQDSGNPLLDMNATSHPKGSTIMGCGWSCAIPWGLASPAPFSPLGGLTVHLAGLGIYFISSGWTTSLTIHTGAAKNTERLHLALFGSRTNNRMRMLIN